MEILKNKNIITLWLIWHFFEMPKFLFLVWKNFILFAINYFSISLLLKTFFSPWRRYKSKYPKGFNIGEFFSTLVYNIFSRIIGVLGRLVLIILGIIFLGFVLLLGSLVILFWIIMPAILILLFFLVLDT